MKTCAYSWALYASIVCSAFYAMNVAASPSCCPAPTAPKVNVAVPDSTKCTDWETIFNGKNLDGWRKLNGAGTYEVKDGVVIGRPILGTPNTFLAYKKTYSDFILTFEFQVDDGFNSGVQFRSASKGAEPKGRVYGYQFELDSKIWCGGVYDEARRGWLYPRKGNDAHKTPFIQGQWNKARLECIGDRIRTWINGVQVTNLTVSESKSGFIALQVHSIGRRRQEKLCVKWKNIQVTEKVEKYKTPESKDTAELSDRTKK